MKVEDRKAREQRMFRLTKKMWNDERLLWVAIAILGLWSIPVLEYFDENSGES